MPRVLVLAALALALPPAVSATTKPCAGASRVPLLEELLPRVSLALDLPGTDQVAIDPARGCIGVQVRTSGTARLVKLLLRGMDVPRDAVELRVVEKTPALPGA